jgi:hypothetical protein
MYIPIAKIHTRFIFLYLELLYLYFQGLPSQQNIAFEYSQGNSQLKYLSQRMVDLEIS